MNQEFKIIEVSCPSCGKSKNLKIPETLFTEKKYGLVKIQVPKGAVCSDHLFVVLTSNKAQVIGYETIDASIAKSSTEIPQETRNGISLQRLVNFFGFNCIAGLIHAKLFGYPSYMLIAQDFDINLDVLNQILDNIIPENYKNSHVLEEIRYDKEVFPSPGYYYSLVVDKRKNALLIDPFKHVIQMPWKFNMDYEKMIMNNALEKEDNSIQLKIIADYIYRFIKDVELAKSILVESKKISEKVLIKKLNENLSLSTINKNRLKLIIEFINQRSSPELIKKIKM